MNSTLNCVAYLTFKRISSDHKIISAKIRLSQRRNKKQIVKSLRYDWSSFANKSSVYSNRKKKFDTLQKTSEGHTLNDEYRKSVTVHIEAVAESILTKPWESIVVRKNEITRRKKILSQ